MVKRKIIGKSLVAAAMTSLILISSITPAVAAPTSAAKLTGNGKNVMNVILMISDGWGYNQILATDYYMDGKAGTHRYERFPTKVAMSTYSFGKLKDTSDDSDGIYSPDLWDEFDLFKYNPTDSASAGTAMSTGTKTYDNAIGVDQEEAALKHIADDFEALGRATGVVSSVEFSHATPASFVAHNPSRNDYSGIANEMIKSSATDVIMGAGNPFFDDNGQPRTTIENKHYQYVGGQATWEALLAGTIANDADGDGVDDAWTLIQDKAAFEALQEGDTPSRVIGVPQVYTTLQQNRGGDKEAGAFAEPFNTDVPDLATMSRGALNVLDNDTDGFFLMIEGGAIDWAGHANQSGRMIEEQVDLNKAVDAVCDWVEKNSSWSETLLIVTGDHETGYLTGTKGVYDTVRNNGEGQMPTMSWNSGDHTNQLIPLFAKGKGAELFKKVADQKDTVRGNYMDNTEIHLVIRSLID